MAKKFSRWTTIYVCFKLKSILSCFPWEDMLQVLGNILRNPMHHIHCSDHKHLVKFEVLMAVLIYITIFWDVMPSSEEPENGENRLLC